ncbi:MAG: CGNR zinc finger domain-containing protein [Ilumatobacteraceae bacterium]
MFYDATKNRSRRFCSDPRCASRTHTAAHRARTIDGHASPQATSSTRTGEPRPAGAVRQGVGGDEGT